MSRELIKKLPAFPDISQLDPSVFYEKTEIAAAINKDWKSNRILIAENAENYTKSADALLELVKKGDITDIDDPMIQELNEMYQELSKQFQEISQERYKDVNVYDIDLKQEQVREYLEQINDKNCLAIVECEDNYYAFETIEERIKAELAKDKEIPLVTPEKEASSNKLWNDDDFEISRDNEIENGDNLGDYEDEYFSYDDSEIETVEVADENIEVEEADKKKKKELKNDKKKKKTEQVSYEEDEEPVIEEYTGAAAPVLDFSDADYISPNNELEMEFAETSPQSEKENTSHVEESTEYGILQDEFHVETEPVQQPQVDNEGHHKIDEYTVEFIEQPLKNNDISEKTNEFHIENPIDTIEQGEEIPIKSVEVFTHSEEGAVEQTIIPKYEKGTSANEENNYQNVEEPVIVPPMMGAEHIKAPQEDVSYETHASSQHNQEDKRHYGGFVLNDAGVIHSENREENIIASREIDLSGTENAYKKNVINEKFALENGGFSLGDVNTVISGVQDEAIMSAAILGTITSPFQSAPINEIDAFKEQKNLEIKQAYENINDNSNRTVFGLSIEDAASVMGKKGEHNNIPSNTSTDVTKEYSASTQKEMKDQKSIQNDTSDWHHNEKEEKFGNPKEIRRPHTDQLIDPHSERDIFIKKAERATEQAGGKLKRTVEASMKEAADIHEDKEQRRLKSVSDDILSIVSFNGAFSAVREMEHKMEVQAEIFSKLDIAKESGKITTDDLLGDKKVLKEKLQIEGFSRSDIHKILSEANFYGGMNEVKETVTNAMREHLNQKMGIITDKNISLKGMEDILGNKVKNIEKLKGVDLEDLNSQSISQLKSLLNRDDREVLGMYLKIKQMNSTKTGDMNAFAADYFNKCKDGEIKSLADILPDRNRKAYRYMKLNDKQIEKEIRRLGKLAKAGNKEAAGALAILEKELSVRKLREAQRRTQSLKGLFGAISGIVIRTMEEASDNHIISSVQSTARIARTSLEASERLGRASFNKAIKNKDALIAKAREKSAAIDNHYKAKEIKQVNKAHKKAEKIKAKEIRKQNNKVYQTRKKVSAKKKEIVGKMKQSRAGRVAGAVKGTAGKVGSVISAPFQAVNLIKKKLMIAIGIVGLILLVIWVLSFMIFAVAGFLNSTISFAVGGIGGAVETVADWLGIDEWYNGYKNVNIIYQEMTEYELKRSKEIMEEMSSVPENPEVLAGHTISKYGNTTWRYINEYGEYVSATEISTKKSALAMTYAIMGADKFHEGKYKLQREEIAHDIFDHLFTEPVLLETVLNEKGNKDVVDGNIYLCHKQIPNLLSGCSDTVYHTCCGDSYDEYKAEIEYYLSEGVGIYHEESGERMLSAEAVVGEKKEYGDVCDFFYECDGHEVEYTVEVYDPETGEYEERTKTKTEYHDGFIIRTEGNREPSGSEIASHCDNCSMYFYDPQCTGHYNGACFGHKDAAVLITRYDYNKGIRDMKNGKLEIKGSGVGQFLDDFEWDDFTQSHVASMVENDWYETYQISE